MSGPGTQLPIEEFCVCRSGTLLPTVQFLQKGLQRHLDTISKLYVCEPGTWGTGASGWLCRHGEKSSCVVLDLKFSVFGVI